MNSFEGMSFYPALERFNVDSDVRKFGHGLVLECPDPAIGFLFGVPRLRGGRLKAELQTKAVTSRRTPN